VTPHRHLDKSESSRFWKAPRSFYCSTEDGRLEQVEKMERRVQGAVLLSGCHAAVSLPPIESELLVFLGKRQRSIPANAMENAAWRPSRRYGERETLHRCAAEQPGGGLMAIHDALAATERDSAAQVPESLFSRIVR